MKNLNPEEVENDHRKFRSTSNNLISIFEGKRNPSMPKPVGMAKKILDETMKLKDHVPLIRSFCNPGLTERHVEKIRVLLSLQDGKDIKEMNMKDLDPMGNLHQHKAEIEDISDRASKEYGFSNSMQKMKDEWGELQFTTVPVDGKNAPILQGEAVELIQAALDDHIIKAQSMRGNPFTVFMADEVEKWEELLMRTSDNMEIWLNV
jgi:dynein heavy chain